MRLLRSFVLPIDLPNLSRATRVKPLLVVWGVTLALVFFVLFLVSVNIGFLLSKSAAALPDIRVLEDWRPSESTRIFDRFGNLVANIHGDEDRVVVPLREISPYVPRAVMAIEDNRFYQHTGVDVRGTLRAMVQNAKGGDVQGGSTLTQQLVKNLFLTPERTITRKLAEAILALRVEQYYEKDRILEMYLNQVYFGNQAYGIEKAARRYFKKPAAELTIAESAQLAGLLKAPEGLSPYAFPNAARRRQHEVLKAMFDHGYISKQQFTEAMETQLSFNRGGAKASAHPYFIAHVINELMREFGEDVVRRGGLKVYTTLNQPAQKAAEEALEKAVKDSPKSSNVNQGALVAIDLPTGDILALVGGVDFMNNQFNNATQARRAAGSTFKPVVYLTGFRLGVITPETMTSDRPVSFNTGYSVWRPKNWDGRFMGAMTIRRALALSRNTPTVQIGMKVGIEEVINTAKAAGVTSHIMPNFSSLLGSSGVSPLEMATVYSTFARGGEMIKPRVLMRVEDSRGQVVPLNEPARQRVFDFEHVGMLNSILVDVVEKGTGTPAKLEGRMVAGKTGTTDNTVDVWFAGFTHDMAAVAWLGNSRNLPLRGIFSSHAAKVWKAYAEGYYKANPLPAKPVIGALEYRPMTTTKVTVTAPVPPPEAPTDEGAETPQEATPPANTGAPVPAAAR
jgi:penicillin-binding protein 1A